MPDHTHPALSHALEKGLERYIADCREKIPVLLDELTVKHCLELQRRHLLTDLAYNPLNTIWSIPYLTIRKVLELFEKLGMDFPKPLLQAIPRSARTDFQKEVERRIQVDIFGLPLDHHVRSALADALESQQDFREFYDTEEWKAIAAAAEKEVRHLVTEYCHTQNGFVDLAASGAILIAAQTFFGDRSLDIFAMGRRWASLWARQNAEQHFVLGKKVGKIFYHVVHAPPPTTTQVLLATGMALAILAAFSTAMSVVSYPTQNLFGVQERQLDRLLEHVQDQLLLKLNKGLRLTQL